MSKFYLSKRVLVVLILIVLVLIGAIGAYGSYLFSNYETSTVPTQDSLVTTNIVEVSQEASDDAKSYEIPLITDLYFVEDSSFLDLTEVFNARNDEADREHYYTLLANPGMTYKEAYFAETPELPSISSYLNDEGDLIQRIEIPENVSYDFANIPVPTAFDALQFNDETIASLLSQESFNNSTSSALLVLVTDDLVRLVDTVNTVFSDSVSYPESRLRDVSNAPATLTDFEYPPLELVQLYTYEKLLGHYADSSYYTNDIDTFITINILNQKYLQSDVVAAQVLADQYLRAAESAVEEFLFSDALILRASEDITE